MGFLSSEISTDEGALIESAAELKDEHLSILEEFMEFLNLSEESLAALGESSFAIAAPLFAALGIIDLDLDTSLNPGASQQVSTTFGHCDAPAAAPAKEAPADLNTVFNEGEEVAGEEASPLPITDKDGIVWTKEDCPSIIAYVTDLMNALSNPELTDIEKLELQNKLDFFKNAKTHFKCEGDYPLIDGDTREPK